MQPGDVKNGLNLFASRLCLHCSELKAAQLLLAAVGTLLRLSLEENLTDLGCVSQLPGGCTDAILPVTWASENGKAVDVFLVLTNNPLWMFAASPLDSLKKHRRVQWFISELWSWFWGWNHLYLKYAGVWKHWSNLWVKCSPAFIKITTPLIETFVCFFFLLSNLPFLPRNSELLRSWWCAIWPPLETL